MLDVALHERALLARVEDEDGVMHAAADEDEKADQDGCDAGAEAGVVVPGSTPSREAVLEEVVVALTERATEDGANERETAEALAGDFLGFTDLGLCQFLGRPRGWLRLMLVGVETDGLLLVGLVDVVDGGREAGFHANEIWRKVSGGSIEGQLQRKEG